MTWWYVSHAEPVFEPLPAIAFSAETDLRRYDLAVAEDGRLIQLTDNKLSYAPAWSPDGSQIAFARAKARTWEECCGYDAARIWVMNADGSDPRAVGPWGVAQQVGPQWMPDGRSVVYTVSAPHAAERGNRAAVVELDIATGVVTALVEEVSGTEVALSSDGTRLAVPTERGGRAASRDSVRWRSTQRNPCLGRLPR